MRATGKRTYQRLGRGSSSPVTYDASDTGRTRTCAARCRMACYWFSNGCTVGCAECDGTQNHVGHGTQRFLYRGMNSSTLRRKNITVNAFTPSKGEMVLDPRTLDRVKVAPNCEAPTSRPTICDARLRTTNTQAECGSKEDVRASMPSTPVSSVGRVTPIPANPSPAPPPSPPPRDTHC